MLKEEGGSSEIETIDSLCSEPCPSCDTENDYFKLNPPKQNFTQKCHNCEEYKKLFLKLKECEEQCYQLKQQINFARQHRLHQINQIKSVDTKLKTGIAESLREPLMKIAQHLLISDKNTFEQLTPEDKKLWTTFETSDIYRFLTGEEDMMLMKSLDAFMAKQKDYTRGVEKSLQTDEEAVLRTTVSQSTMNTINW